MEEFFTLISNFGFPIVVAAYLLFRFENKIDKLSDVIAQNSKVTDDLSNQVRELRNTIDKK